MTDSIELKVIIVGDSKVGKTAIVRRYLDNNHSKTYKSTIGIDYFKKIVDRKEKKSINVEIWDTTGNRKSRHLIRDELLTSKIVLIVCDASLKNPFTNVKYWINRISSKKLFLDINIVLNKIDTIGNDEKKKQNIVKKYESLKSKFEKFSTTKTTTKTTTTTTTMTTTTLTTKNKSKNSSEIATINIVNLKLYRVSAKLDEGINDLFDTLIS